MFSLWCCNFVSRFCFEDYLTHRSPSNHLCIVQCSKTGKLRIPSLPKSINEEHIITGNKYTIINVINTINDTKSISDTNLVKSMKDEKKHTIIMVFEIRCFRSTKFYRGAINYMIFQERNLKWARSQPPTCVASKISLGGEKWRMTEIESSHLLC